MKFLIDARLPPRWCDWLRYEGRDAQQVVDVGMLPATDAGSAAFASEGGFVLVGKDEDLIYLRLPDRFAFL